MASISACRLLPRPEISTPSRRFTTGSNSVTAGGSPGTISPMTRASRPPRAASSPRSALGLIAATDDDQADAHVEGAHHVIDRHDRRHCAASVKSGGTVHEEASTTAAVPCGSIARQVVGNASTGDVRHALDAAAVEQRTHERQIRPVRLEEGVAERVARARDVTIDVELQLIERRCGGPANSRWCAGRRRARRRARRRRRSPAVDQPARSTTPTMKPARSYSPSP